LQEVLYGMPIAEDAHSGKYLIKGCTIDDDSPVGNQQKWDTLVKERSGRNGSVVGLPEQVVVALSSG